MNLRVALTVLILTNGASLSNFIDEDITSSKNVISIGYISVCFLISSAGGIISSFTFFLPPSNMKIRLTVVLSTLHVETNLIINTRYNPPNLDGMLQVRESMAKRACLNNISVLIEGLTVTAAYPDVLPPRRLCRHRVHLHPRHARQRHGQSHRPHMRSSRDLLHHLNSFLELMFNYGFTEAKKMQMRVKYREVRRRC